MWLTVAFFEPKMVWNINENDSQCSETLKNIWQIAGYYIDWYIVTRRVAHLFLHKVTILAWNVQQ